MTTHWSEHICDEQWSPYAHPPTGPSGSRQQLMDPAFVQAPALPANFPQPPATAFAQTYATGGFPQHQHHFIGGHSNLQVHNGLADFPHTLGSNGDVLDGSHTFIPGVNNANDDRRHRREQRRPPHWEDDPYPASSLRESITWSQIRAALDFNSHHHSPGFHHCFAHPLPPCCPRDYRQSSNYTGRCSSSHQPHGSPCSGCLSCRTHEPHPPTPVACGNHTLCDGCGWANTQHVVLSPVQTRSEPQEVQRDRLVPQNTKDGQPLVEKRDKGGLGRWLAGCFSAARSTRFGLQKASKSDQPRSTVESTPPERQAPSVQTNGLRKVSPSSTETSATSSKLLGVSSMTETVITSLSSDTGVVSSPVNNKNVAPDRGSLQSQAAQSIPRPLSSASSCQCYPPDITLHLVLQHNAFDRFIIDWDVSHAISHLWWGATPEEILSNTRHINHPSFFGEYATNPPVRHMFINGLGDFPLARCQGDPDPSRGKDKEKYLYNSGNGDERVEMRTLPWPIRITGSSEGNGYITLGDVFWAIHKNFQEYITKDEYEMYTIERKRTITSAYHVRQKVLDEARAWPHLPTLPDWVRPDYAEDWTEDGVMRCDYLGTQVMFRGLEVSPDREGFTLFLGPV